MRAFEAKDPIRLYETPALHRSRKGDGPRARVAVVVLRGRLEPVLFHVMFFYVGTIWHVSKTADAART